MTRSERKRSEGVNWLGLVSFGFFLMLLGIITMITPNLSQEVIVFFKDFTLKKVNGNIFFPVPESSHPVLYIAAKQFSFIFGFFQIIILVFGLALRTPLTKIRDTIFNVIFWFGVGFFFNMLANKSVSWFGFLAGIIISIGLAIVVSNLVKLFTQR
jgi:hypothetical protein